jgi:hypothetical protein
VVPASPQVRRYPGQRDEDPIEETKVAAIRDKRKGSGIVQELLEGWLASRKARK